MSGTIIFCIAVSGIANIIYVSLVLASIYSAVNQNRLTNQLTGYL